VLRALVEAGHEVALVVTRPPKRRGREEHATDTPAGLEAARLGMPVSYETSDVTRVGASLGVVVAYGRLIRPEVLDALPMVNVHFSLLPRWRGAAPVERAILAGDRCSGVSLMKVEEGLDTGGVYRRAKVAIGPHETAEELSARLAALGAELLVRALAEGLGEPEPQVGQPTWAEKLRPEERRLEWTESAEMGARRVRVGRAWTTFRSKRLVVLEARPESEGPRRVAPPGELVGPLVACGEGWLHLLRVAPEGRRPQSAEEWLRGARPAPGERLGC
jgi:methionyl-tRNA formyltransferase